MEKVQWISIDKKQNGLKYSKNDKSSTPVLNGFNSHSRSNAGGRMGLNNPFVPSNFSVLAIPLWMSLAAYDAPTHENLL